LSGWSKSVGNYHVNKTGSPSDVPGLPRFKREPGLWKQWDRLFNVTYRRQLEPLIDSGHYFKSSDYSMPDHDDDHSAHHNYKREPSPESWEEWGTNIGNYYANKYEAPNQVPGLPRPWLNNKREPETLAEWEQAISGFYPAQVRNPASRSEKGGDSSSAPRKNPRRERRSKASRDPVAGHPELVKGDNHTPDNNSPGNGVGGNQAGGNHAGDGPKNPHGLWR